MRGIITCFLGLMLLPNTPSMAQSQADSSHATVAFVDGSTQGVENLGFVYEWVYESVAGSWQATVQKTSAGDFHYKAVVRGVELEKVIPLRDLGRIEIGWNNSGTWGVTATSFIITLKDGQSITLKEELGAPSSFLQKKPMEEISDPSKITGLIIEGSATVEGQRGKFIVSLPYYFSSQGGRLFSKDKAIKDIDFKK